MIYLPIEQKSSDWFILKAGKVSGTRYSLATSGKKNGLVYTLANEILDGCCEQSDYVSDDMQFGIDYESEAIDKYEIKSGIKFKRGGVIMSDYSDNHLASPDGFNDDIPDHVIICEVKCTQDGSKQMQRFKEGIDSNYIPQIKNYFAVSDDIKEVHWISYCPFRKERELVVYIVKREDYEAEILKGREMIKQIGSSVESLINEFNELQF